MSYFNINKLDQLKLANEKLCIYDDLSVEKNKNLIFIYSPPKVGSTTIVSTIRLYALNKYTILHIHDEKSLKIMCNIDNITINEIIQYNQTLNKNIYVIDIYRSPIEQKMSDFFEGICIHHFNNSAENINKYNVQKIITRFNNLFPHLSNNDYFKEKYNISQYITPSFDYNKQYLELKINDINYIKLRLKDVDNWNSILSTLLNIQIPKIVTDYETANKPINEMYQLFKQTYKIPTNLFELIKQCPYFNYYYSEQERNIYIQSWINKLSYSTHIPYNEKEYILYSSISKENQYINESQSNHYIDMGCKCVACTVKRNKMIEHVNNGGTMEKIVHSEANVEYLSNKLTIVNKLNQFLQNNKAQPSNINSRFKHINKGRGGHGGINNVNKKIINNNFHF